MVLTRILELVTTWLGFQLSLSYSHGKFDVLVRSRERAELTPSTLRKK